MNGISEPGPWRKRVEIGDAVLYLGDALELRDTLPKAGCIITDPPYGISHPCDYAKRGRGALAACNDWDDVHDDNKPFDPRDWLALGVPSLFWGANYFADKLPPSSGWIVWDKERPDDLDQSTCELAWTDFVKGVRRFRFLWNGMMRAGEKGENYHPTQKPVALMEWVLGNKWFPGGPVIDPYMSSAPVGVACAKHGIPFSGVEISERYFDTACERITAAYAQGRLFQ